jgi:hypothetical protein
MPEAAMNEDDLFPARENQVRTPRKRANMQAKSVSHGVDQFPHEQLRFGIPPCDCGHAPASLLWRQYVHIGNLGTTGLLRQRNSLNSI